MRESRTAAFVAPLRAGTDQDTGKETSKYTILRRDAMKFLKARTDGAKKDDGKAAAGVGAWFGGWEAGSRGFGVR